MIHTNDQAKKLKFITEGRLKKRGETFFYQHQASGELCWGNNDELRTEMKNWRELKKKNILVIREGNNREFEINGRVYYTLVIQDNDDENNCIDELALGVGFMVSGYVYFFVRKENRDAVFSYVMK